MLNNLKNQKVLFIFFFLFISNIAIATQFGESGLFYSPSSYAILPGVFEFGIMGHKQFYGNNLEYPSPMFFAMGVAPRIESFVCFPDIFTFGNIENLHQQYGNVGLKFRFANLIKRRMRIAVTTYSKYLTNVNMSHVKRYLPGCIIHLSHISNQGAIFHLGLNGYKEQANNFNFKLNLGYEFYFYKEILNFYVDTFLSPKYLVKNDREWMGAIGMMQIHPHFTTHLETGFGLEMVGKKALIFIHVGFTFTSGQRIVTKLRKKKDELPEPPPLENLLPEIPEKKLEKE